MMAFTHLFMSLALAILVLPTVSGGVAPLLVLAAAVVGGLAPDLDLLARHRRTLHYPVGFPVLALVSFAGVLGTGAPIAALLAVLFGAATLHVLADLLGGSAERAPWDPVTEFGVYNHVLDRWHRPRRVVQYSGSPGDFLFGAGLATVVVLSPTTAATADLGVGVLLVLAGGYTLARRRLSGVATRVRDRLPANVRRLLPVLSVEEQEGGGTTVVVRLNR